MRRIGLFLLILFASNANANDCKYLIQTADYELCVAGKPLSLLPVAFALSAGTLPSKEEFYSHCADEGNEAFSHIRNTQEDFYWYRAEITPKNDWNGDFVWQGKIVLALKKGGFIEAKEVIGMKGFRKEHYGAEILLLHPQTRLFSFEDMSLTRQAGKMCLVFISFPRNYEPKQVEEIVFEEGK